MNNEQIINKTIKTIGNTVLAITKSIKTIGNTFI
jgi:hypothetical protein